MINLLEIEKALDLLSTFQLSYPSNGRLPLTNGLSTVPDSKVPDGEDKINLKNLYEMSGHKKSHGLVSIRFLGVLAFFFFGVGVREMKNAITELYKNLSYATLSSTNDSHFDATSEFISRLSFSIKKSTLANRYREEIEDAEKAKEIINKTTFVELPNPSEQEIVDELFKDLEHKKTKHSHVESWLEDVETIEIETQAVNDEFSELKEEFDKVNNAAAEQKSQTDAIDLIDDVLDEKKSI